MRKHGQPGSLRQLVPALFVAALAIGLMQGGLIGGAWAVSAVMVPYFGWYFWRLARWPQVPARESAA